MDTFDVDSFIEQLNNDSKKTSSDERLTKLVMSSITNQGSISLLPFLSKSLGNSPYQKLENIKEFYGNTSLIDSGEGWMRIYPKEMYGIMSPDQSALYDEVSGLFDTWNNISGDFNVIRVRKYTLIAGIIITKQDRDGIEDSDCKMKPALLIYPSVAPIKAIQDAIQSKISVLRGRKDWVPVIFNRNLVGRKGVLQLNFRKSDGFGYDSTASIEINSDFSIFIDPDKEFPASYAKMLDEAMDRFYGWHYDYQNNTLFNEVMFKEMKEQLQHLINSNNEAELAAVEKSTETTRTSTPTTTINAPF